MKRKIIVVSGIIIVALINLMPLSLARPRDFTETPPVQLQPIPGYIKIDVEGGGAFTVRLTKIGFLPNEPVHWMVRIVKFGNPERDEYKINGITTLKTGKSVTIFEERADSFRKGIYWFSIGVGYTFYTPPVGSTGYKGAVEDIVDGYFVAMNSKIIIPQEIPIQVKPK